MASISTNKAFRRASVETTLKWILPLQTSHRLHTTLLWWQTSSSRLFRVFTLLTIIITDQLYWRFPTTSVYLLRPFEHPRYLLTKPFLSFPSPLSLLRTTSAVSCECYYADQFQFCLAILSSKSRSFSRKQFVNFLLQ